MTATGAASAARVPHDVVRARSTQLLARYVFAPGRLPGHAHPRHHRGGADLRAPAPTRSASAEVGFGPVTSGDIQAFNLTAAELLPRCSTAPALGRRYLDAAAQPQPRFR